MQPLVYLAVRAFLGWLQHVWRFERAFISSPLLLVAAGAMHSWAVVYSLFVAVHTRAMRYQGYHDGYTEHLPSSVAWTEMIAVASLWIWLIAGCIKAAIAILDEDADGLPVEQRDVKGNQLTKIMRSPVFNTALGNAHSISCAGLFVSILVLCFSMSFMMKGAITMCEMCLLVVSVGFALPHALLAVRRWNDDFSHVLCDSFPSEAVEAVAAEAAALGPQLCIVFALADAPGHAFFWQKVIYFLAAVSFLTSLLACAKSPSRPCDVALPPEVPETFVCLALDGIAVVLIVLSYPHLNTLTLWLSTLGLFAAAATARTKLVQEFYMEWIEQIFVIRSDEQDKRMGRQRIVMRRNMWILAVMSAATALWDIFLHPAHAQEVLNSQRLVDAMSHDAYLALRWLPNAENTWSQMLPWTAEALHRDAKDFAIEKTFPEHRLVLFKFNGAEKKDSPPLFQNWQTVISNPPGQLAQVADKNFPATFNTSACALFSSVANKTEGGGDAALNYQAEIYAAYSAACDWYKNRVIHGQESSSEEHYTIADLT